MGRLLQIEPCPVCNYYVEGTLHYGGSTRARLFIYHRYVLAVCHDCHQVVSVLVKTPEYDIPAILAAAQRDIEQLEALAAQGDAIARRLLPLHMLALEDDEQETPVEALTCTNCGSSNIELYRTVGGDEGEHFDDGTAWLPCPSCEEGQLWVHAVGTWDELDSGL